MSADLDNYFDTMQRNHDIGTTIHKASMDVASAITRHYDAEFSDVYDAIEKALKEIRTNTELEQ